jgi:hypothetical protein
MAGDPTVEASSRVLLPASRIGGVIGRGGDVIKNIREMSGARINIAAPGSDERDPQFRMVRALPPPSPNTAHTQPLLAGSLCLPLYRPLTRWLVLQVTVSGPMGAVCHAVQMVAAQAGLFDTLPRGGGRHKEQGLGQSDDDMQSPLSPQQQLEPGLRLVIDAAAVSALDCGMLHPSPTTTHNSCLLHDRLVRQEARLTRQHVCACLVAGRAADRQAWRDHQRDPHAERCSHPGGGRGRERR